MNPKTIFATLGVVAAIVSFFYGGISLLAGGVIAIGVAVIISGPQQ